MRVGKSFFTSKVGRRFFVLFIICALFPIIALSTISYFQVSKQLQRQNMDRLENSAITHSMIIYEKLKYLENNLKSISLKQNPSVNMSQSLLKRFKTIAFIDNSGNLEYLTGTLSPIAEKLKKKAANIKPGKTTVYFEHAESADEPSRIFLILPGADTTAGSSIVIGELDPPYLWGIGYENLLPPMTDLCIIDQYRKILTSSFPVNSSLLHTIAFDRKDANQRSFEYTENGNTYIVSTWSMFIKSGFYSPTLIIMLRNNKADIYSALSNFKIIFPLVVLLSIWVVLLLSMVQIRKSLVPLEKIKEGTQKVANNDFKSQVIVNSNDEFEDVARSFNEMAGQLDAQFEAMTTRSKIDREILSSLSTLKIINTALKRMFLFFSCDSTSINLVVEKKPGTFRGYITNDIKERKPHEEFLNIPAKVHQILEQTDDHIEIYKNKNKNLMPTIPNAQNGEYFLLLPIFIDRRLKGSIVLGFSEERQLADHQLKHARQMANQVVVALSNSSLVEEMEKLNLGTLEALARTVDAKSTWTAGHSERVTDLSLKIAKVMGLSKSEMDILQRAAYLHDIGKIGIPLSILDKPGKLTDDEFKTIKDHPTIGAKILEPIHAYEDAVPIVHQHHEKFDGTGYPGRLSGEDICMGARILAVADVYDAVASDRPYRAGWVQDKAVKLITDNSGTHFDPQVVDAFLAVL